MLKEAESGSLFKDVCRKYGINDATYYHWESRYGGIAVSDLKGVKELESELGCLKRMYADLALENRGTITGGRPE